MSQANDFLTFRKMLTPIIIQVIFWIGVTVCIIGGIITIATGAASRYGGMTVLYGLLAIFLGPLVVRSYCELLIVIFRINGTVTDIKNKMNGEQE